MSGKKGRSGRYPKSLENYRQVVIQKAWNKTNYKLDQTDAQSYTIASQIVVKDITDKQSVDAHVVNEQEQSILSRYGLGIARIPIDDKVDRDNVDKHKDNVGNG